MGVLDGVRIGPLDPDKGENFGQVGGQTTARRLIRHHVKMHPPALVAALGRVRQDARSTAVDRVEAEDFIRGWYSEHGEPLPEDSKLKGFAVRGDDEEAELQVLTFSFTTKSGRTAKGFVPYHELPSSVEAGDAAVAREDAKKDGVAPPLAAGPTRDPELLAVLRGLTDQVEQMAERIEELEAERDDAQTLDPAVSFESGAVELPVEPWPGYEGSNAQDVRQRIREANDATLARSVLAWETRPDGGANRSTVVGAANQVLDHSAAGT